MCSSKIVVKSRWGADDTWAIVTFLIMIPCTTFIFLAIANGFGSVLKLAQAKDLTGVMKNIFMFQLLFMCGLTAAKTSILFFYLRIFPDEKFRLLVWITIAFNTGSTLILVVIFFTKGRIIEFFRAAENSSIPINSYMTAIKINLVHCVVSFTVDVWMLILPMTQIYNLGLRTEKKMRVMAMFGVGLCLTTVSLVRTILQAKVVNKLVETGK
ncbi:hypothetical protein F53441_5368 [Fusarium austroafricanum]|uniref:Rhodopsin domain-containing protein n=1 Tax=Fusarium austroafricanum TaxID=2364996 RepID=A0A8H4KLV5_9HYPO|nr:hypothetical protein F53441_5368 [Fusarium austroafricanum]